MTLTLNGAAVNGGFLRGTGSFALTGGTALSGVTTFTSTSLAQPGPASYLNFTHGGALTVNGPAASPAAFDGFTNQGSGSITVGGGSRVNAADFQSCTLALHGAAAAVAGLCRWGCR